jgi:electron transfer flavoprotein alpha subunit
MRKLSSVFVIGDKVGKLPDLLTGAQALGDNVYALVLGTEADARTAVSYGAQTAVYFAPQAAVPFEEYAASMAKVIRDNGGAGLVMLPSGKNGKCMGAKLAARLNTALVNDIDSLSVDGGITARRMVYGGLAFGTDKFTAPLAIITVGNGVFEAGSAGAGKSGAVKAGEFVAAAKPIKRIRVRPKEGVTVNLAKAKRVISVGRGLKSRDDLGMIERLAKAIGAEVGCTRPIAEGEHWLESARYIGVSGVMLKNDVFLNVGVSGQIQHMVGSTACKTIISINKDKNAPVFKFTDYGIVGDLYKVIPKLIEAFKI